MRDIIHNIFSRDGVLAFARAIGFAGPPRPWPPIGDVSVELLGRRGTLTSLLLVHPSFDGASIERVARQLRSTYATELQLFMVACPDYTRVCVATFAAGELRTLMLEPGRIHPADVDALAELVPQDGESGLALALRHMRALDRVRVTHRFFGDFRGQRSLVADAWTGLATSLKPERDQLALLLLSRLMFLYFLQRRGFLCGDHDFFLRNLRAHFAERRRHTFYRAVLRPLFFGVLNRRPERRTARAAALGALPYLNGGLFERHQLERRFPDLDLPDDALRGVFEHLLEHYRFTASEEDRDLAVDPEMLGRVFEGLMAEPTRQNTGTFYTPSHVVRRMVRSAFDAHLGQYPPHHASRLLREVRVLDPACGSGAFLLSALSLIAARRATLENADINRIRQDVVARNLHGVDIQHDAALLCALRLWLCLIPATPRENVQPLPNLDRRVRQGDALIDPLDLAADAVANTEVRAARRVLQPLVQRYTTCEPEERQAVHRLLGRRERQLARAWVHALRQRMRLDTRELRAQVNARDLFGQIPTAARAARDELRQLEARMAELNRLQRNLRDHGALPFFSFNVHFADAQKSGFDIILCNPPWVRSHHWPKHLTTAIRRRFAVCRDAGQVDLALVFLERTLTLLAPGGTLAIILPAKFLRSASAGAARQLLLRHMDIVCIEDHSLDQRSIFAADAFTAIVIARRKTETPQPPATITMIRRKHAPLAFPMKQQALPFDARDDRSPWLVVPATVRAAMQRMHVAGPTIAAQLRIRRGVVTGANSAIVIAEAKGKLGDLAWIRSEGGFEAHIEEGVLRPLVRGADVTAWHADVTQKIIYCHNDEDGAWRTPPRRTARYLREHTQPDSHGRLGMLRHVGADGHEARVAWHDLANTLNAVVLPTRAACLGGSRTLVALNTVYYIATNERDAHLLAAYFNSLPVRTFVRAIAERAKDAHFRFFACTVGQLPLPVDWRGASADRLLEISRTAHADGAIDEATRLELDELVARAFRLTPADLLGLRRFDQWLRGAGE